MCLQLGGDPLAPVAPSSIRLFKFTKGGPAGGTWTAEQAQASVDFFNRREDRPGAAAEWCLAVGSDIEVEVSINALVPNEPMIRLPQSA